MILPGEWFARSTEGRHVPLRLLEQVEGSAGSIDGFAFFCRQVRELEPVTIAGTVSDNALHFYRGGGDWDRELQVNGRANVPSGNEYPRDTSLIDI